jgi:hypothetical protein
MMYMLFMCVRCLITSALARGSGNTCGLHFSAPWVPSHIFQGLAIISCIWQWSCGRHCFGNFLQDENPRSLIERP